MNIIPSPSIKTFFYDDNGHPLSGGQLFSYKAGTNELKDTYTDSTGLYVNTNPIVLDDAGGAYIFIQTNNDEEESDAYSFELLDRDGVLQWTASNISSLQGKQGTPGGPKGDRGLPGLTGPDGPQGARGRQGDKGAIGPMGKNGSMSEFWRTAGTYTFVVPEGVTSIDYVLGGGGGGFFTSTTLPAVSQVATGTAGQIKRGTIAVTPGVILNITIGAGGLVTNTQLGGNGKASTLGSTTITTITSTGGNAGVTNNITFNSGYYKKMDPFQTFKNFEGVTFNIIPNALEGESSPFGEGGNIYKNANSNATGNCSSGGTGIPYLITPTTMGMPELGRGGDGILILNYTKTGV